MAKISILLNVELLCRGQVHQAEAVSVCRGIGIRPPCAQVLIRGVGRLRESKLVAVARQTWVVHALGELRVRVVAIHGILGSTILWASVHGLLEGTGRL